MEYLKKVIDKQERQLKLLLAGFSAKAQEIGLKLSDEKADKELLIKELLELSDIVQELRYDYDLNLKTYKGEKEND